MLTPVITSLVMSPKPLDDEADDVPDTMRVPGQVASDGHKPVPAMPAGRCSSKELYPSKEERYPSNEQRGPSKDPEMSTVPGTPESSKAARWSVLAAGKGGQPIISVTPSVEFVALPDPSTSSPTGQRTPSNMLNPPRTSFDSSPGAARDSQTRTSLTSSLSPRDRQPRTHRSLTSPIKEPLRLSGSDCTKPEAPNIRSSTSSRRLSPSKETPLRAISELDWTLKSTMSSAETQRLSGHSFMSGSESVGSSMHAGTPSGNFIGDDRVIHPSATWYKVWNYFIMFMVVFSTFFTPVRYGFMPGKEAWLLYLDVALDSIFTIDILLTFNVAIRTKEGLIVNRKKISWAYVSSPRFRVDILATVPFDMLWGAFLGENTGTGNGFGDIVYGALGLLRLLRVNRILELFRELQKSTKFNLLSVVVLKFVLFILLITHTAGCIMYGLARANDFAKGTWVHEYNPELPEDTFAAQYAHALYWAVGTFKAGPAHASLSPRSVSEMLVACLAMLLNICMNVYLVSSMAALLTQQDTRIYAHRSRLQQLGEFANRYSLPKPLQRQLQSYLWFKFNTDQDLERSVMSSFPELYQSRINHVLYASFITSMSMFQGCAQAFLSQLYGALQPSLHMAQHLLVNAGEPSRQLQIIASGEVDMYYDAIWFETRLVGETITEVPFVCNVDQQFTVRTRMLCRILSIDRRSWLDACQAHPVDLGVLTKNLLTICKQRAVQSEIQSPAEAAYEALADIVESHIVRVNEHNVGSLCFSAQRGDIEEMKRFLAVTNASAADYDKRAPLHIAAANGQVEAIKLLLTHRANINCVDNFGRTPLLEACRSKQHGAAQLLFTQKADLGFSAKMTLAGQMRKDDETESTVSTGESVGLYDGASQGVEAGELCQAAADAEQLWYLRALLKYGAQANSHDYDARTALHVACASGNKPAVKLLLTRPDINMDARDNFGRTPLMEAVRHGHEACARLLKAKGAHHGFCVDIRDNMDSNAVHAGGELCQAAFSNQIAYLGRLISYCGLNVDVADYDKRTALMLACAEGNWDAAINLVQQRADVNLADRWGHTALSEATEHGHPNLARVLQDMSTQQQKIARAERAVSSEALV